MYETPEEMQRAIDLYFLACQAKEKPEVLQDLSAVDLKLVNTIPDAHPTVTGLALCLGFAERKSLIDYSEKPEFVHTIKKAKARVERYIEERLYQGSPAGCIFNLKNNFGWRDQTEVATDMKLSGSLDMKNATHESLDAKLSELLEKVK